VFTGIVTAVGKITRVSPTPGGVRAVVDAPGLGLDDVAIGDSIAVNGACLTVAARNGLEASAEVNLEKALRLSDRLGGHLVSGHVDGVGEVVEIEPVGDDRVVRVRAPAGLARYIARKGSITVHGVSLTVNSVKETEFEVNLVPHTLAVTNLKHLLAGSRVNLEVDLLARYLEQLFASGR
jgi:riboflavin synthase